MSEIYTHSPAIHARSPSQVANSNVPTCRAIGSECCHPVCEGFVPSAKLHSRYNLKRRVASLPSLASEVFAEKIVATQASAAATAARASFEKICSHCSRTYYSENAFTNHLLSQKHKIRVAQISARHSISGDDETGSMLSSAISLGEPIEIRPFITTGLVSGRAFSQVVGGLVQDAQMVDDPVTPLSAPFPSAMVSGQEYSIVPRNVIPSTTSTELGGTDNTFRLICLFCNLRSSSIDANVTHMASTHSMFIPERSYLIDIEGLVGYLRDRVMILHECLFCGLLKPTTSGIQAHMRDKGHCMIAFESEKEMIEVGQFYDFRSTYLDDESDEYENGTSKVGGVDVVATEYGKQTAVIRENEADDDGWESDDSGSQKPLDNDSDMPAVRHRSLTPHVIYHNDYELHLLSGRTAGHRSLARYYRQNLHNYPTPAEWEIRLRAIADSAAGKRPNKAESATRGRGIVGTRADGGLGMLGVPDSKRRAVRAMERKNVTKAQRAQTRYRAGNEKRANYQKHFRDPLLQ